jgi:hypothetical protein
LLEKNHRVKRVHLPFELCLGFLRHVIAAVQPGEGSKRTIVGFVNSGATTRLARQFEGGLEEVGVQT